MRARYTRARALWICLLKRVRLVDDASKHEPLSECGSIDQWLAFAFRFERKNPVIRFGKFSRSWLIIFHFLRKREFEL